jgi:hypothetical protein
MPSRRSFQPVRNGEARDPVEFADGWVASVHRKDSAWAAINVSSGPIGEPFRSSEARSAP